MPSVAILGNIGSGKSELSAALAVRLGWTLVQEPVEAWRSSGFLDEYYKNPVKYGFAFQCYAFITRVRGYAHEPCQNRVYDSHAVTDPVFAGVLLTEKEQAWYKEIYQSWESVLSMREPDLFIYLNASATTCLEHIKQRDRSEEVGISPEFLESLSRGYGDLVSSLGNKVVTIDASQDRAAVLDLAFEICCARFSQ